MGLIVFPENSHVEGLTPNTSEATVFGDTAIQEVIQLKWGPSGGP